MRQFKKLILLCSASAIIASTGCSMLHRENGERSVGRELDDKVLTSTVEKRLKQDQMYKYSDVDVKTFSSVVQLSGFVDTPDQKQRAEEIAGRVEGVSRVVNNIAIKSESGLQPTGRQDNYREQPVQSNP